MGRIIKQKPKPHVVIPDTSSIWHEDKQLVVDPAFDSFWTSYGERFKLELKIPEVVKGELLFQQTNSALKSLKKANEAFAEVQRVTHCTYRHRVSDDRVRSEVERKFNRWAESKEAAILETPVNVIIWPRLIQKSIWRQGPFLFDPKNPDNEKGFRDALILETVKHFCAQETRDIHIAFLCKDELLRETAEKYISSEKRFYTYEQITDFKTYLDLTEEKLEDEFIKAIVRRASEKFFTKGEQDCLYFRDSIRGILQDKYKKYFDNPEESETKLYTTLPAGVMKKWEATDSGTFWVARSRFVRIDENRQYVWANTVTYVRLYAQIEHLPLSEEKLEVKHRVLFLPFIITWRARVSSDGRFWKYSYISDELKDNQFKQPSEEDRRLWNLKEPKSQ